MNPEEEIKVTQRPPTGKKDYCKWMMLAILLLAFFLRAFKLDGQSCWFDETVTVYFSNQDMLSLLQGVLEDRVHPPLFYVLMHFWLLMGKEQFVVRAFPVLWGTLSVAAVYPVGRLVGGRRVGTLSALLLAISP